MLAALARRRMIVMTKHTERGRSCGAAGAATYRADVPLEGFELRLERGDFECVADALGAGGALVGRSRCRAGRWAR